MLMWLSPGTEVRQVGDVRGQDAGGALEQPLGLALRLHLSWKYWLDLISFGDHGSCSLNKTKTFQAPEWKDGISIILYYMVHSTVAGKFKTQPQKRKQHINQNGSDTFFVFESIY